MDAKKAEIEQRKSNRFALTKQENGFCSENSF
jgi:hypothetical protein